MFQRMKERVKTAIEARKEGNNNKGFTLVELIVVIVILAILVGVTIGGVFSYVNKSRINTDINNASSLTSTLSVLTTVKDAKPSAAVTNVDIGNGSAVVTSSSLATVLKLDATANTNTVAKLAELLPEGIPASKTGVSYKVTTTVDSSGMLNSVRIVAVDADGDILVGED